MKALSILDRVRGVPSAAASFLVEFGYAFFQGIGQEGSEESRLPCITFCEGLVGNIESTFLRLEKVDIANNNTEAFGISRPMGKRHNLSRGLLRRCPGSKCAFDDH